MIQSQGIHEVISELGNALRSDFQRFTFSWFYASVKNKTNHRLMKYAILKVPMTQFFNFLLDFTVTSDVNFFSCNHFPSPSFRFEMLFPVGSKTRSRRKLGIVGLLYVTRNTLTTK